MYETNYLSLPRLPIPSLQDTCSRWLKSTKALHESEASYAQTEAAAREFFSSPDAAALQEKLTAMDASATAKGGYPHSYIEKLWDDMYFGDRSFHPVYFSPFFKIIDTPDPKDMKQTERAAKFVHGFARWTRKVVDGEFEEDMAGKQGLCTSSVGLMFNSAKIPGKDRDTLSVNASAGHVAVMNGGDVFIIDVLDGKGGIISVEHLTKLMDQCVDGSQTGDVDPREFKIPALTSYKRGKWAEWRKTLDQDALKLIDDALLMVCLDDDEVETRTDMARNLLIGNTKNRWWDKQQLIVAPNGMMGFCFEHSYSDGLGWARFIHEVMCDNLGYHAPPVGSLIEPLKTFPESAELVSSQPSPKLLTLDVGEEEAYDFYDQVGDADWRTALGDYLYLQERVQLQTCDFEDFGKNEMKTWGVSPDAGCQMAYQLAYYRIHGEMPGVYESCATRKFFHGRTETIRSSSPEMKAMVLAVNEAMKIGADLSSAKEAVAAAAAQHVAVSKNAQNGEGVDRHLKALKDVLDNHMAPAPQPPQYGEPQDMDIARKFFSHPMIGRSGTWDLSTSNASGSPFIDIFGFGAVSETGYGIGYLIFDDKVVFNITCFNEMKPKYDAIVEDTYGYWGGDISDDEINMTPKAEQQLIGPHEVIPNVKLMEQELRKALHDIGKVMKA